ncbi:MAG: YheU family protein [Marinospirillum sp.]|uniref:YheU family protein n=1 Tax=Marinospirillum sp. TaxID=2183934 RepID=UPI0019FEE8C9|nr:YheU family protein [Marinospirillum sp.]MBE0505272.1 YheU family protein [Marinospirillum sp.]
MHQRFVEIPSSLLEATTLDALLEVFVTRQGYDTTSEEGIQNWTTQLKQQLQRGELVILHDIETETTEVMVLQQAKSFLQALN